MLPAATHLMTQERPDGDQQCRADNKGRGEHGQVAEHRLLLRPPAGQATRRRCRAPGGKSLRIVTHRPGRSGTGAARAELRI